MSKQCAYLIRTISKIVGLQISEVKQCGTYFTNRQFATLRNSNLNSEFRKCWNCGANKNVTTDLFCLHCNSIQEPHETENCFKIFNIKEAFEIDQKILTKTYHNMQTVLHPDKFSTKTTEEKRISEHFSSLVNKAYDTLQSPLKRAIHMLSLRGAKVEEDQKVTDPDFLIEIMELNEQVEEADSPDQLRELYLKNKQMMEKIGTEISNSFAQNDIGKAKDGIIKMKYYNSVHNHINSLLRERGIID